MGAAMFLAHLVEFFFTWADAPDPGDAGTFHVDKSAVFRLVSAGASETRTLPDPVGQGRVLYMIHDTDGGSVIVTGDSPINDTDNNTMTFTDAGEWLTLISMAFMVSGTLTYEWRVLRNDGVTLSTV